jgi:hypothetical protein
MPQRSNLIPRPVMPRFRESSALRSGRDSDDTSKVWQRCEQMAKEIAYLTNAVIRTQQELNRLRMRKGGATEVPVASESPAKVRLYTIVDVDYFGWNWIKCRPDPGWTISAAEPHEGTGYAEGDELYLIGDTGDTEATLIVEAVSEGGVPTAVSVQDGGDWADKPKNATAMLSSTDGDGQDLVLDCTFTEAGNVYVALQPELRNTITSQVIDGEDWTYDGYDADTQYRVAHSLEYDEEQVITPRFLPGDKIPVWYCANTRVADPTDPNTILTKMAITGREWAKKYEPPVE